MQEYIWEYMMHHICLPACAVLCLLPSFKSCPQVWKLSASWVCASIGHVEPYPSLPPCLPPTPLRCACPGAHLYHNDVPGQQGCLPPGLSNCLPGEPHARVALDDGGSAVLLG